MVAAVTLDLDGLAYRYLDEGAGHPVVMVHGNPSWSYMYRTLVAALRDDYRVLAPDHIGMGRSEAPPRSHYRYDLAARVRDFSRFMDHAVPREPVTLVAHDWGGAIALAWAVERPERLARLVLLNTAAFPMPAGKRLPIALQLARAPLVGAVLVRGLNAFAIGAVRLGVRRRLHPIVRRSYLAPSRSWRTRAAIHAFVKDIPVRPADRSYHVLAETAARLSRLASVPTLICWGVGDPVLDLDYLAEWERRLPAADVHRLDAGHYVLEDAPEAVVKLVEEFLRR